MIYLLKIVISHSYIYIIWVCQKDLEEIQLLAPSVRNLFQWRFWLFRIAVSGFQVIFLLVIESSQFHPALKLNGRCWDQVHQIYNNGLKTVLKLKVQVPWARASVFFSNNSSRSLDRTGLSCPLRPEVLKFWQRICGQSWIACISVAKFANISYSWQEIEVVLSSNK